MNDQLKPSVLFVDDEPRILTSMRMLFRGRYRMLFANSGDEALALVRQEPVDVIVSDQRMPNMTGIELFREIRKFNEQSMRILLTGYSDLNAIISSINEGEIFRFVNKPWNNDELKNTIAQAVTAARHSAAVAQQPASPTPVAEESGASDILVLDDDTSMAPKIQSVLGPDFKIHNTNTLRAAVDVLETNDVAVVISETRVEGAPITRLLGSLKMHQPQLVSIILTDRADAGSAIELINEGQIFRMIAKPIHQSQCRVAVKSALRHHARLARNPELHRRYEVVQPEAPAPAAMAGGLLDRIRMLRSRIRSGA